MLSLVLTSVLALSRSPNETGSDIFPTGLIGLPPKPCNGYSGGCNMCWLRFIFSKVFKNKMLKDRLGDQRGGGGVNGS
jgi:hypothetical protein